MPFLGKKNSSQTSLNGSFHNQSSSDQMRRGSKDHRKADWKRHRAAKKEAKVVQKSAGHVNKIVQELIDGLPFLLSNPNQPIAKFLRSEIVVGNLLGRGVFARVYDVKDLDLHDEQEKRDQYRSRDLSQPFGNSNVDHALAEAQEMIVMDDSSSEEGEGSQMNTIDSRPIGATSLDERPFGGLNAIAEGETDGQQQQQQSTDGAASDEQNGDDSTTAGTSSTAPASAPPTPPLTPAIDGSQSGLRQQNPRLRSSTANYQHMVNASRRQNDQPALRSRAREVVRGGESGYALKHLTKTLLRNPNDFHLAAAALLLEAKYLSKLDHPNIIKVTGLAMGGSCDGDDGQQGPVENFDYSRRRNSGPDEQGLESGQHDSYFLMTERLADTLDRRIRQWKRDQPNHKKLAEQSSTQKISTWKQMMRKTSYALQISNALAYLHERRLLYRDLKPQNIGFMGDNQTICIFNFGLCRELNPSTNLVTEDPVSALFGALSWKYAAVECCPLPIVQSTSNLLAQSTRFLQGGHTGHSSRSLRRDSLSNSIRSLRNRKTATVVEAGTMQEIRRELNIVHEQFKEENSGSVDNGNASDWEEDSTPFVPGDDIPEVRKTMTTPKYDERADVYSWAMVYYEMLTLNQPFSGMKRKEYRRKVAGPKGGQRPGVYQFDLVPSMISLLQRAWDQNPKKRPTMESVGRNLQLILKELEQLIKDEQRALLKAAGGTEEAVAAFASKEERAARRAKRKLEREKRRQEKRKLRQSRNNSVVNFVKKTSDGIFARNKYRNCDVRESILEPPTVTGPLGPGLLGPMPNIPNMPNMPKAIPIPGLDTAVPIPNLENMIPAALRKTEQEPSESEIDFDALEYEVYSSEDEQEEEDSVSSGSELGDDSLAEDPMDTVVTIDNSAKDGGNHPDGASEHDEGTNNDTSNAEDDGSEGGDVVGDAISAMRSRKSGGRSMASRDRNLSSHSGHGVSRAKRRTTRGGSVKARQRRTLFDPVSLQRRGTNRMSRRTMRLSRASVWMMRRDVKALVIILSVILTLALFGAAYFWYQRCQATWLGMNLDELGLTHNETEVRAILQAAMTERCRYEVRAERDPNLPMLFQGGALSPVDLECMEEMERLLERKMVRVTGFDPSRVVMSEVGFLGIKKFAKPPSRRKKSRWKRKKAWKFFREESTPSAASDTIMNAVPLVGSQADPESSGMDSSDSEGTCEGAEDDVEDQASPTPRRKPVWKDMRAWKKLLRENPSLSRASSHVNPSTGLFGLLEAKTESEPGDKAP